MAIPSDVLSRIDQDVTAGITPAAFKEKLTGLLRYLFTLPVARISDTDLAAAVAYLAYLVADRLYSDVQGAADAQYEFGESVRVVLAELYEDVANNNLHRWRLQPVRSLPNNLRRAQRRAQLGILRSLHNVNTGFYRNADRAQPAGAASLVSQTIVQLAEDNLRAAVGSLGAHATALFWPLDETFDDGNYAHAHLFEEFGWEGMQIGRENLEFHYPITVQPWDCASWDMTGLQNDPNRWAYLDSLAQQVPAETPFLASLQQYGDLPGGAELVESHYPLDQFGLQHTVNEYRFVVRSRNYRIWIYTGLEASYRLAMVTTLDTRNRYFEHVRVIADGYEGTAVRPASHRHAMGLHFITERPVTRFRGGTVFYTFLAGTDGIEEGTQRVARQIAWHTDQSYAILGNFRRDSNTNWVPSPEAGEITPADGPTFPADNPISRFDYAINVGAIWAAVGVVQTIASAAAQHLAVCFKFHFPRGAMHGTISKGALLHSQRFYNIACADDGWLLEPEDPDNVKGSSAPGSQNDCPVVLRPRAQGAASQKWKLERTSDARGWLLRNERTGKTLSIGVSTSTPALINQVSAPSVATTYLTIEQLEHDLLISHAHEVNKRPHPSPLMVVSTGLEQQGARGPQKQLTAEPYDPARANNTPTCRWRFTPANNTP